MIATRTNGTGKKAQVWCTLGIGGRCGARFSQDELQGLSVRRVIERVAGTPQESDPAQRTASVLGRVLIAGDTLDVEVAAGPDEPEEAEGRPVLLDDAVWAPGEAPAELVLRVSREIRGGDAG